MNNVVLNLTNIKWNMFNVKVLFEYNLFLKISSLVVGKMLRNYNRIGINCFPDLSVDQNLIKSLNTDGIRIGDYT